MKANRPKKEKGPPVDQTENNHENAATRFMVRKIEVHLACGDWIVDSGAIDHLTGILDVLVMVCSGMKVENYRQQLIFCALKVVVMLTYREEA